MSGERQLKVAVILGIAAVAHALIRLNPECRCRQQFQYPLTPIFGENPSELRPCQNLRDLFIDRLGQNYDAPCPRGGYRLSGNAVWVQGCRYDRVGINDINAQARRSAL